MTLPLLAFLIVNIGGFAYVIRSLVVSTMGEDFVVTAKARGFTESRIIFRHVRGQLRQQLRHSLYLR